jgi:hypothetical protein
MRGDHVLAESGERSDVETVPRASHTTSLGGDLY